MKKYRLMAEITSIIILGYFVLTINVVLPPTPASGQAGGPRQIPGEMFGCHFANPADKVNTNPFCLGLSPPIPDCKTIGTGSHDYPCRDSSHP